MHFVLDLDYTLFDTATHWDDWLKRLEGIGISREDARVAGESLFGVGYTLEGHGELLGIPQDQLAELVSEFELFTQEEAPNLVYDDVVPFLEKFGEEHQFTILTFGHPDYQQFKVKWSGLGDYIDDVRIARPERMKSVQLSEMLRNGSSPLYFVDDNPKELGMVRDAKLDINLARMFRKGARHATDEVEGEVIWKDVKSLNDLEF